MSSTFRSSTRSRFRIMQYVSRNWLSSLVLLPVSIRCTPPSGGSSPHVIRITVPTLSSPRRPARPAICVYSPGRRSLKSRPSCLRVEWNTHALAGAFTPIANVSVQKSTLTSPRQKSISTISLTIGSRPAWCTPMPRLRRSRRRITCGSVRSRGCSLPRARSQNMCTAAFSSPVVRSWLVRQSAAPSTLRLLKAKTMNGISSRFRMKPMRLTSADRSPPVSRPAGAPKPRPEADCGRPPLPFVAAFSLSFAFCSFSLRLSPACLNPAGRNVLPSHTLYSSFS
mmetsp:Transcript_6210/g.21836  ORF Transcript_6210/g.21836 Transcript_6210/m.21836 type:complete len:282 (-) Transcript_6210:707-1552(-)